MNKWQIGLIVILAGFAIAFTCFMFGGISLSIIAIGLYAAFLRISMFILEQSRKNKL